MRIIYLLIISSLVISTANAQENFQENIKLFQKIKLNIDEPLSGNYEAHEFEGRYYLVDYQRLSVYVFNQSGDLDKKFGRKGRGPGEFFEISEFLITDGQLVIADLYNQRISKFDLDGELIEGVPIKKVFNQFAAKKDKYFFYNQFAFRTNEKFITLYDTETLKEENKFFEPSELVLNTQFPIAVRNSKNIAISDKELFFVHQYDYTLYIHDFFTEKTSVFPLESQIWNNVNGRKWNGRPTDDQMVSSIVLKVYYLNELINIIYLQKKSDDNDSPHLVLERYNKKGEMRLGGPVRLPIFTNIVMGSDMNLYNVSEEDGKTFINIYKVNP